MKTISRSAERALARNDMAVRHPKRGKAHRSVSTRWHGWEGGTTYSTACGRSVGDKTESAPIQQTAEEDRCAICWPPAS